MPFLWFKRPTQPRPESTPTPPRPAHEPEPRIIEAIISIPTDKIAERAYQKWVDRGRPVGSSDQDWRDAEAELRAEAQPR